MAAASVSHRLTIRITDTPVSTTVTAAAPHALRTHHQDAEVLDAIPPESLFRRFLVKPNMWVTKRGSRIIIMPTTSMARARLGRF
jgi:hypothetical protein